MQGSLSTGLRAQGFTLDQAFAAEQALSFVAINQHDAIIGQQQKPPTGSLACFRPGNHDVVLPARETI